MYLQRASTCTLSPCNWGLEVPFQAGPPVQVVQANEHVPGEVAHNGQRNATVVEMLDEGKQIVPKDLQQANHPFECQ